MVNKTRWADITEIQKANHAICVSDYEYRACGIPLYWNYDRLYVDNQNTNTIVYSAIKTDIEKYYTMPLIDIFVSALESFIVIDFCDRVYNRSKNWIAQKGYKVIKVSACQSDWFQHWQTAIQNKEPVAFFVSLEKKQETAVKEIYEKIAIENSPRVNIILNNVSRLPKIEGLVEMLSDTQEHNMRFYLLGCEEHCLKERYGAEAMSIKNRCENWIFMDSRELSFMKEISELCGIVHNDAVERPLISVSELQRLNKGEVLIMQQRQYPYIAQVLSIKEYCQRKKDILAREKMLKEVSLQFEQLFETNNDETDLGENT